MTEDSVLTTQRDVFYKALLDQDWPALSNLYADDYMLVRADGTMLGKEAVLLDLADGELVFQSIELTNEHVRLAGSVALLTGDSHTVATRRGIGYEARFRLIAIYAETDRGVRLLHFQSTEIPAIKA